MYTRRREKMGELTSSQACGRRSLHQPPVAADAFWLYFTFAQRGLALRVSGFQNELRLGKLVVELICQLCLNAVEHNMVLLKHF